MECGILPMPPAVEARSPNHWTAREVPRLIFKTLFATLPHSVLSLTVLFFVLFPGPQYEDVT